ncbi:ABC transporter ATP-binding protein [Candidatus Cryosericum hinesii]|uniref:ABC transporter ATP-binding protein n=1 Tax=Candidatus Cryosericum hinesii TaxID=2290915 RepID=A0ABX9MGW5_9BACT|nr:ABC transporter ATP-binding protein [Candidatus Cryosericum hinesii]
MVGTVWNAGAREQQAQVIINLGQRADRRPGVLAGRLLVDGNGGRQPFDEVDVRFLHQADELPGIGRERLDIPALPLGIQGVECQRGLARAGNTGDDDDLVARETHAHVFQVVDARALDENTFFSHSSTSHFEL